MIFEKQIINIYKGLAYTRCDDKGLAYYFSSDDFPCMKKEAYPFLSSLGHELSGYIYSYESPREDRLVIFDHGFFGGHRSYMREIEMLCKKGYRVFAYDHTGCMESGGKDPNGMAQSLHDLDDCIKKIKSDKRFEGMSISVVGHSWGAFSTLNISAFHPDITHIVAISGFVSVKLLVRSFFGGILGLYRKAIMKLERESNGDLVDISATDTLAGSSVKALLIYSEDDKLCRKDVHYDALDKALKGKENIELMLVEGKGHNPNYTAEAVRYLGEYSAEKGRLAKKKLLSTPKQKSDFVASFDWKKMTEQDEEIWNRIFAHLEK